MYNQLDQDVTASHCSIFISVIIVTRRYSTPHQSSRSSGWACLSGSGQRTDCHLLVTGRVSSVMCRSIKQIRGRSWRDTCRRLLKLTASTRASICRRRHLLILFIIADQLAAVCSAVAYMLLKVGMPLFLITSSNEKYEMHVCRYCNAFTPFTANKDAYN